MRELHVNEVRAAVAQMVIDANCCIGEGMLACLERCKASSGMNSNALPSQR